MFLITIDILVFGPIKGTNCHFPNICLVDSSWVNGKRHSKLFQIVLQWKCDHESAESPRLSIIFNVWYNNLLGYNSGSGVFLDTSLAFAPKFSPSKI